jgi:hypothetical protein
MTPTSSRDHFVARRVLLAGLALGLLAEITLYGSAFGISLPILVMAVLVTGWVVRRTGRAIDPLDAWLPVSAVILAVLVAIRADPFLGVLDALLAVALTGASLAAISGLAVTRRSASVIAMMAAWDSKPSSSGLLARSTGPGRHARCRGHCRPGSRRWVAVW